MFEHSYLSLLVSAWGTIVAESMIDVISAHFCQGWNTLLETICVFWGLQLIDMIFCVKKDVSLQTIVNPMLTDLNYLYL